MINLLFYSVSLKMICLSKVINEASEMTFPEISVCLPKPAPSLASYPLFPSLKIALEYQMALEKMD